MSKMLKYAEALFQCLPADYVGQIRVRMCKELGRQISYGMVGVTISWVRAHYEEVGYTIPHAKRGVPGPLEKGRFFAVLVERDGTFYFNKEHRAHLRNGTRSTVDTIRQQMVNLRTILATAYQYERSSVQREYLSELQENFEFMGKRAARILRFMDAA